MVGTMASGEVVMVNTVVGEEGVVDADVDEVSRHLDPTCLENRLLTKAHSFLGFPDNRDGARAPIPA